MWWFKKRAVVADIEVFHSKPPKPEDVIVYGWGRACYNGHIVETLDSHEPVDYTYEDVICKRCGLFTSLHVLKYLYTYQPWHPETWKRIFSGGTIVRPLWRKYHHVH